MRASRRSVLGPVLPLLMGILVAAVVAILAPGARAAPAALDGPVVLSGTSPMPNDVAVPPEWLPPGASAPDEGPSAAIFPPQRIPLRFNHTKHTSMGLQCVTCHEGATRSDSAQDSLIPEPKLCDGCHGSDHSKPEAVLPGRVARGDCAFCHQGYQAGDGNRVAPLDLPRANLSFTHRKHFARNIACSECHGVVADLQLATRDQLPRMQGCFRCHQSSDSGSLGVAKAHAAKSACTTCHLRELGEGPVHTRAEGPEQSGGRMRTTFATGVLTPPQWLHASQHTPDWIQRHREVAAEDSQFCANCHTEDYCTACHDGRVRPRQIHPADYLSMHPIEARMSTQRCTSCHQEQSFCLTCHMRLGVTQTGPTAVRESGQFHPNLAAWTNAPRGPQHHSFEAQRNLNACVSCHTEQDCVRCHGGQGIGAGFDPHGPGFMANCGRQYRRNPRPCLVCHEPATNELAECR